MDNIHIHYNKNIHEKALLSDKYSYNYSHSHMATAGHLLIVRLPRHAH